MVPVANNPRRVGIMGIGSGRVGAEETSDRVSFTEGSSLESLAGGLSIIVEVLDDEGLELVTVDVGIVLGVREAYEVALKRLFHSN